MNLSGLLSVIEIKSLKKTELQEWLKLRKKPSTGKKSELVERVLLYRLQNADENNNQQNQAEDDADQWDFFQILIWTGKTSTL